MRALTETLRIRAAEPEDVPLLHSMVRELASYERAAEQVTGTEQMLAAGLFGEGRIAEAVIAEVGDEPAGFALFFPIFSTWLCLPGIWLEDLFVRPIQRRAGVGRALLTHIAQLALDRGCARVDWSVLRWNTPALRFYDSIGAMQLGEWQVCRLTGEPLRRMAGATRT